MTIQEAISRLSATGRELYSKICTVDAVDEDARTVDCTPIDGGAPLLGVNLQANQDSTDGMAAFPAVGSYVVVSFLSPSVGVAVLFDKVDKITVKIGDMTAEMTADGVVFNGGALGGLINIRELTDKINALIAAFNNHTHEIPTGGVAVAGSATAQSNPAPVAVPPVADKHDPVSAEDYEDETIKH